MPNESRRPWIGRCGSIFWRATQFHHWLFRVRGRHLRAVLLGNHAAGLVPCRALGQAVLLLRGEPDAQLVAGGGGQRHDAGLAVIANRPSRYRSPGGEGRSRRRGRSTMSIGPRSRRSSVSTSPACCACSAPTPFRRCGAAPLAAKPYACPYGEVCPSLGPGVEHPVPEQLPGRTDAVAARARSAGCASLLELDELQALSLLTYADGRTHEVWLNTWGVRAAVRRSPHTRDNGSTDRLSGQRPGVDLPLAQRVC